MNTRGKRLTALPCLEIWKSQPPGTFRACTGIAKHIFPHYLINGMIFGKKKLWNVKRAF
jgi:hypothetical protein